jgi:hypothetical protein
LPELTRTDALVSAGLVVNPPGHWTLQSERFKSAKCLKHYRLVVRLHTPPWIAYTMRFSEKNHIS